MSAPAPSLTKFPFLSLPQVLLSGLIGDPADLDLAKWAGWLGSNGYDSKEGWAKIVAGVRAK